MIKDETKLFRDLMSEKLGIPMTEIENNSFAMATVQHRHSWQYALRNEDVCIKCGCLQPHRHKFKEIRTEDEINAVKTFSKCECGAHRMEVKSK